MLYDRVNPHGGDIYGQSIRLDYSANTNPYGTPQGVLEAVRESLPDLHHYPDPYCRALVQAIARHDGVAPGNVLCGNGAAELIYGWCRAVRPKTAVLPAPSFSEYGRGLEDCRVIHYPLRPENDFDLTEELLPFLRETQPEALFLCTPNNPTGRVIDHELLGEILEQTRESGCRVFLDECFLDLADRGESRKTSLERFPHMTILKAFTKSYGMAGLRLGYCLSADRALLRAMSAGTQPWNVSTPAQCAGIAALREEEFLRMTRQTVSREREWLAEALRGLGFTVVPSHANYLLFRGAPGLTERLLERGIAIRSCENYQGLGAGWYRIAVRLRDENILLTETIRQVIGGR